MTQITDKPTIFQTADHYAKTIETKLRLIETVRVVFDVPLPSVAVTAIGDVRNPTVSTWMTGRSIYKIATDKKERSTSSIGWAVFMVLWIASGVNRNLKRFDLIADTANWVNVAADAMPFVGMGLYVLDATKVVWENKKDALDKADYLLLLTKGIGFASMFTLTSYVGNYKRYSQLALANVFIGLYRENLQQKKQLEAKEKPVAENAITTG